MSSPSPFMPSASRVEQASYLLMAAMILLAVHWHLLSAAISGMLVYAITRRIEQRLLAQRHWPHRAKMLSIFIVILVVCLLLFGVGLGLAAFLSRHRDFDWLLIKSAALLDALRTMLPESLRTLVPQTPGDLRDNTTSLLRQHGQQISTIGFNGMRAATLALVGLVIGAMVSWSRGNSRRPKQLLTAALGRRLQHLEIAFETVVFAQVRISALNTALTAIYLLIVLPLFGQHLPFAKTLVLLTFIVGLLPVAGNLISNTIIMIVSATLSLQLALASLLYLMLIHKLEYFVNARIIGGRIHARAWELLIAMIVMETVFGIAGLISAPVLYAYLKNELAAAGLITDIPPRQ